MVGMMTNFLAGKRDGSGSSWNALAKVLRHVCPRKRDSFCRRPQAHPTRRVDACASSGLPRAGAAVAVENIFQRDNSGGLSSTEEAKPIDVGLGHRSQPPRTERNAAQQPRSGIGEPSIRGEKRRAQPTGTSAANTITTTTTGSTAKRPALGGGGGSGVNRQQHTDNGEV
uniref:Uncharacterized protein n=1 Tax=Anopheles coluzzii TaxID=1518534 RepID=A0A8W7PV08_ANOCL